MKKTTQEGVWSLGKGRYLVRVWYVCPKTGRRKKAERVVEAKSARDATKLREALREERSAVAARPARERLDRFARSWMKRKLPSWKRSTRVNNASIMDTHISPKLGDYWIDAITPEDVVAWRDDMDGEPDSINSRLRLLRQLLGDAAHAHGIANPAARVESVRVGLPEEPDYIPTAKEGAAVLEWLRTSERYRQWHPLAQTLALTGLRFSEATALRWSDVDFDDGWIHVQRSQVRNVVDVTKSAAGLRSVVLPPELAETLRAHQAATGRVGQAWVFLSRRGTLHQTSAMQKPMRAALAACGLSDRRISAVKVWRRLHNNLLRQVATEAVRQALMGHSDAEVGIRHYSRVEQHEMAAAAARVVRLMNGGE